MGWQTDDGQHEGWTTAVFAGGKVSVGSTAGGALVRPVDADGHIVYDDGPAEEIIDGREAIGWRGMCGCGWAGPLWRRVHTPAEHDFDERRIYDAEDRHVYDDGKVIDAREWGDAPTVVDDAVFDAWQAHIRPLQGLEAVRQAARELAAAQARLDDAVRTARTAGSSWADIGGAVGISRQSAHERWAATARR
jgi:hypothetical protein